ncbi:hypothetical protein Tco_0043914, partial [Tanacetum coccineum]
MANLLTTDGIKDGTTKKKENARNKRRARARAMLVCWSTAKVCKMNLPSFWRNCPRRNCPRMNQATTSGGNRPNPVLAIKGNPNQGNNSNQARGRAFGLGVAEAPQDPNVVTGTFSLNNQFAAILFDSSADYSFISTNFLPLIDVKIRMDWLYKRRAKIVCFERIFQIPLSNGEILEVHGEHPKGNLKQLKTMKVNELKLKHIPIVRDFPGVFPEELSGLPSSREVEFHIDLIHGAMPIAKLPYHLAPTEMQELSNQLKELQEK